MNWDCTFLTNWDFTPTTLWRPTENVLFYSQHLNFYSKKFVNLSVIFYNWEKKPRFTARCTKSLKKLSRLLFLLLGTSNLKYVSLTLNN